MTRRSAVVFEPHNDDFVIGMGATGVTLLNAGWEIYSVVLTDGRFGGTTNQPERTATIRATEKARESEYLGTQYIEMGYEDRSLSMLAKEPDRRTRTVSEIAGVLRDLDPDVVFLTGPLEGHMSITDLSES